MLLLMCGDVSLNLGPISFGVVDCRSVRQKGPSIFGHLVDSLSLSTSND